jgi:hypothetical protein
MYRTFAWCVGACLLGTAALGQEPGRPAARGGDPRAKAFQDPERLPANRLPDQPGAHSLLGPSDTRPLSSRAVDQGGLDLKSVSTRMSAGADGKHFGPLEDFSNRNLSQVQGQLREPLNRQAASTPDPSLKPNRLNLPAQTSSFLSGPGPGRDAAGPPLKAPENFQQFLSGPTANRLSGPPTLKAPENFKQFQDRP